MNAERGDVLADATMESVLTVAAERLDELNFERLVPKVAGPTLNDDGDYFEEFAKLADNNYGFGRQSMRQGCRLMKFCLAIF